MKIKFIEIYQIDQFKRREYEREATVLDVPPIQSGSLYYFKKNQFEYLVLGKDSQGRWVK